MWIKALGFAAVVALGAAGAADAAVNRSVDGRSAPWTWVDGGLNTGFQFGAQDGLGPTVVTLASAGITAGGSWFIGYLGGATDAFGTGIPGCCVDAAGYVGSPFKDDDPGSSGNHFPSHYTPGQWGADGDHGVFLNALMAVFADSSGAIVGNPFAVGWVEDDGLGGQIIHLDASGAATPLGATQIQLGLNDDIFSDNAGALSVCVGASSSLCPAAGTVPEPNAWALMLLGFGLMGGVLRQRRPAMA